MLFAPEKFNSSDATLFIGNIAITKTRIHRYEAKVVPSDIFAVIFFVANPMLKCF